MGTCKYCKKLFKVPGRHEPFCELNSNKKSKVRLSISDINKIAAERGGKCVTTEYKYGKQKLIWECALGHQWENIYNNVYNGNWCTICGTGLYERICRIYMEELFEDKFFKVRPEWLIGHKGRKLELDGYSEKLGIAFEHNGEQHYNNVEYFSEGFEALQINDKIKLELCKKNNVKLIVIPSLYKYIKLNNLKDFIKNQAIKLNIKIPSNWDEKEIDIKKCYTNIYEIEKLEIISKHLEKIQLSLVNKVYLGATIPIEVKCNYCGFTWAMAPNNIIRTHHIGCRFCRKFRFTKKVLLDNIFSRGGQILLDPFSSFGEKDFINLQTQGSFLLKCKENHEFKLSIKGVHNGRWCPLCNRKLKYNISDDKIFFLAVKARKSILKRFSKNKKIKTHQIKLRYKLSFSIIEITDLVKSLRLMFNKYNFSIKTTEYCHTITINQ